MNNLVFRDIKYRKRFLKNEKSRLITKSLLKSSKIQLFQKFTSIKEEDFTKTLFKNRCIITGRGRSISRQYRLSRLMFRELSRDNLISGIKKSSW